MRAGRALDRVLVAKGAGGPRIQEVIELCRTRTVAVRFEPKEALDRAANGANHQGIVAFGAAHQYAELDSVLTGTQLVLVLDGVEDPHNLGAIVRSAHAAGAGAVVIPERRATGLTETVAKAAAGALEYLPVVRVANVTKALESLKKQGFWIYGLDERGEQAYTAAPYATPTVFVLGGEGRGLHQNVKAHCDVLIRIPMAGEIASLNVSVAAGVVLFDWRRRTTAANETFHRAPESPTRIKPMASKTAPIHDEERLPAAHSLREAVNTDNTLEGYAAMNNVPPDSEIAQAAVEHPIDEHHQIARLAYKLFQDRGGDAGSPEDDWYRAEQQIRASHPRAK